MNTYRTQFIARCPSDGQRILYSLEMQSEHTVMVEDINEELDNCTEDYQESIAQRLAAEFPQCSIRLHGIHQGIEITSTIVRRAAASLAAPQQEKA